MVLRSLPEPLLSFSLHAAVVQAGEEGSDVAYVAELAALLSPPRRATLTCVLAALARVAETRRGVGERLRALPRRVTVHRVAEVGQTQPRRAQSLAEGKDDGGKTARELRAVANALEYLIEKHPAGFACEKRVRSRATRRGQETRLETAPPGSARLVRVVLGLLVQRSSLRRPNYNSRVARRLGASFPSRKCYVY